MVTEYVVHTVFPPQGLHRQEIYPRGTVLYVPVSPVSRTSSPARHRQGAPRCATTSPRDLARHFAWAAGLFKTSARLLCKWLRSNSHHGTGRLKASVIILITSLTASHGCLYLREAPYQQYGDATDIVDEVVLFGVGCQGDRQPRKPNGNWLTLTRFSGAP